MVAAVACKGICVPDSDGNATHHVDDGMLTVFRMEDDLNGDLAEIAGYLQNILCYICETSPAESKTVTRKFGRQPQWKMTSMKNDLNGR